MLTVNLFRYAEGRTYYFSIQESNPDLWICAHRDADWKPFQIYAVDSNRVPDLGTMVRITDSADAPSALLAGLKDRFANQTFTFLPSLVTTLGEITTRANPPEILEALAAGLRTSVSELNPDGQRRNCAEWLADRLAKLAREYRGRASKDMFEQDDAPSSGCRACGADLSRMRHLSDCENAESPGEDGQLID